MQLTNIVVGVTDAPTSRLAGERAFELAAVTGATVHVVTAVEDAESAVVEIGSDRFEVDDLSSAQSKIDNWVRGLSTTVPWKVHATDDKPADAILEVARSVDADLIVVGNVRMQGLGRLLGSVGNDIAHHAPCSVLIVKTV
ncbi:MAG: universal stress protein [Ilumatobacteraceae bacterium]